MIQFIGSPRNKNNINQQIVQKKIMTKDGQISGNKIELQTAYNLLVLVLLCLRTYAVC